MTERARQLLERALSLPARQQAWLAVRLNESIALEQNPPDAGAEAAWDREIARRLKKIEDGTAVFTPAEEALRQIRKRRRARKTG